MPVGQGFAITQIKEFENGVKLMCLRAPLQKFEWKGDYSKDSVKWTPDIMAQFE